MPKNLKSRGWCFTLNNYTPDDTAGLASLSGSSKYLVFGREVGESGTPHLQGYVFFANPRALAGVSKLIPRAHLEPSRGTPRQASDYCKKGDDYVEHGEHPFSPVDKGVVEQERWRLIRAAAEAGDYEAIPERIRFFHPKLIDDHRRRGLMNNIPDCTELKMDWYCGATGTGHETSNF